MPVKAEAIAQTQQVKIKMKSYDHRVLDSSVHDVIEAIKRTGVFVNGPVPIPTKKEIITILRSVHKHKDSREQYERRTHSRILYIRQPNPKTFDVLKRLDLPAGISIEVEIQG